MAKFRTNHSRQNNKGNSGTIIKVGIFGAIISGLFFLFNRFTGSEASVSDLFTPKEQVEDRYEARDYFLPSSTSGEIIAYKNYTLSYSEKHEQAEWVAYILTKENLNKPWSKRSDNFLPDPKVKNGSSSPSDYRNSGYDRGHLVPAADMAYDKEAQEETFFMSNISPQSRNFNKGIWRELEELTRGWAKKFKQLYVVTGPVLNLNPKGSIGANKVSVPAAYYKVLLDLSEPELKGIGFVIENQVSFEPLYKYVVSIDAVEQLTGIDFFPDLMPDDLEADLESSYNIDLWEFSKTKFDTRVEKWNKQ